ncbi:hypothetical protein SEA_DUMPTRUCK_95 [Gordonia phage DumpTruck]|nr:hypothetical protein SEA_DUMPTRUCK_95 [Gordonia phage DumpTruck]
MAEAYEFDNEDPKVQAGLAKIEEGIMEVSAALFDPEEMHHMMPVAWGAGVELVGYNRTGEKVRKLESLSPNGQGFSATRGVMESAAEAAVDAFFAGTED